MKLWTPLQRQPVSQLQIRQTFIDHICWWKCSSLRSFTENGSNQKCVSVFLAFSLWTCCSIVVTTFKADAPPVCHAQTPLSTNTASATSSEQRVMGSCCSAFSAYWSPSRACPSASRYICLKQNQNLHEAVLHCPLTVTWSRISLELYYYLLKKSAALMFYTIVSKKNFRPRST